MGLALLKCCRSPSSSVSPSEILARAPRRMACESCGVRFSLLKKKKKCCECLKDFCSSCIIRSRLRELICHSCQILTAVPLNRLELMKLPVRALRHYLVVKRIPTDACTEKAELVELIINPRRQVPNSAPEIRLPTPPTTEPVFAASGQCDSPPLKPSDERNFSTEPQRAKSDFLDVDVHSLSVRQLKEALTQNFVTYRGCCEKTELVEKAKFLQEEMRENRRREIMGLPEENLCKICMDAPIDCVLLDCGHMLSCTRCGKVLSECPVCRQNVVRVVHTFRS